MLKRLTFAQIETDVTQRTPFFPKLVDTSVHSDGNSLVEQDRQPSKRKRADDDENHPPIKRVKAGPAEDERA